MRSKTSPRIVLLAALPLVALGGCASSSDQELSRDFLKAQDTFDQAASPEDFLKVAGMYQEILDGGVVCGAVLYNQGNALMRAGQRGRAIAAYRRAKRYRPLDPHLDANLNLALGSASPQQQRRSLVRLLMFWQDWISYPGKFHLAAGFVALTLLFGIVALYVRGRLFARLALVGVALSGLFVFSAGYDWYRFDHLVHGVIIQADTIARKGNAASYKPAFEEPLAEGSEFRLAGRRGDWLLVRLAADREGWVKQESAVLY